MKPILSRPLSLINKLIAAICYSVTNQKCLMNNTVKDGTDLKGCFWNPEVKEFTCVVSYYDLTPVMAKCKDHCPKVCSEKFWRCNNLCIPVSQPCNGSCMSRLTFKCNDICIPTNKPCQGNCNFENQINCNGFCVNREQGKAWIIKFGCKGKLTLMKRSTFFY